MKEPKVILKLLLHRYRIWSNMWRCLIVQLSRISQEFLRRFQNELNFELTTIKIIYSQY